MANVTPMLLKRLVLANRTKYIEHVFSEMYTQDIAKVLNDSSNDVATTAWRSLTNMKDRGNILIEMSEDKIRHLIDNVPIVEIAKSLKLLGSDDITYILRFMSDESEAQVLSMLDGDMLLDVSEQLGYQAGTAGAIMNTFVEVFNVDMLISEAKVKIGKMKGFELSPHIYCVDDNGKLVGVATLQNIITAEDEQRLLNIVDEDYIKVGLNDTTEYVSHIVEKYDMISVPVVDEEDIFMGIITFDDIIDIIKDNLEDDIYKIGGFVAQQEDTSSIISKAFNRLPWLVVTMFGSLISGLLYTHYSGYAKLFAILVPISPMVMALGGNTGSQTATIVIRGLATGKPEVSSIFSFIRELMVASVIAIVAGFVIFLIQMILKGNYVFGLIGACSLFISITISVSLGVIIPVTLSKIKIDPAIASAPFISMTNDIIGIIVLFTTGMVFLKIFNIPV